MGSRSPRSPGFFPIVVVSELARILFIYFLKVISSSTSAQQCVLVIENKIVQFFLIHWCSSVCLRCLQAQQQVQQASQQIIKQTSGVTSKQVEYQTNNKERAKQGFGFSQTPLTLSLSCKQHTQANRTTTLSPLLSTTLVLMSTTLPIQPANPTGLPPSSHPMSPLLTPSCGSRRSSARPCTQARGPPFPVAG